MATVQVQIINAFVEAGQGGLSAGGKSAGGNRAGVVLDADDLSRAARQSIAGRVGVSETAFVSRSQRAAFKLEFFTPNRQIAHCGHATIATFCYLAQAGRITGTQSSKETIDGKRDILIAGDMAFMEQTAPRYTPLEAAAVLSSLSIGAADLIKGCAPTIVNTGNSFLIVPLRDEAAMLRLQPDFAAIEKVSDRLDVIGYYVFSTQTRVAGRAAGARMFAPRFGIREESATGTGAGPLACYLHDYAGLQQARIVIEQGYLMQPPSASEITVDLSIANARIEKLMVGGRATLAKTIEVQVEAD